jgi:sulfur-oxidizing protein SoxA
MREINKMKKILLTSTLFISLTTSMIAANAGTDPEADRKALTQYFTDMNKSIQFEGRPLKIEDYRFGSNIFDPDKLAQFKGAEDFPPYADHIEAGEKLWKKAFANGKTYSSCAGFSDVKTIRAKYPIFDDGRGEVVNLDQAVNECRTANNEKAYAFGDKDKDLTKILAYLSNESRGQKINVVINSPGALDAYNLGEMVFHTRRGQLNQSCANCHISSSGRRIRSELLSPVIGHTTHFPVYRTTANDLVSLQHRYVGCMNSLRAFSFPANSTELKAIEFYESFMSNGLEIDGPTMRP